MVLLSLSRLIYDSTLMEAVRKGAKDVRHIIRGAVANGAHVGILSHCLLAVSSEAIVEDNGDAVLTLSRLNTSYTAVMTPILTLFLLALSNVLFDVNARVSSSNRQYIGTSVDALGDRARKALPKEVANNVESGYQRGEKLAQGWGTTIVDVVHKTSYPILSTLEVMTQRGASAVPLSLPYPFIYDAHSQPTSSGQSGKKTASPPKSESKSALKSSAPAQAQKGKDDAKMAAIDVGPSLDGGDQGKTVEIASRVSTESKDQPAPPKEAEKGNSLYAQLKKDGDLPGQQEDAKLSVPSGVVQTGASSEEDDHSPHGSTANGAPKKKKSGSKKKKGGVSHVHPPSFKEGLHQAEEHDAQAQH
jgi:hypothetical protein